MECLVNRVNKETGEPPRGGISAKVIEEETGISMGMMNRACANLEARGYISVMSDGGNVVAIAPIHPNGYRYLSMRVFGRE